MNLTSANDNLPETKRRIRVVKERSRATRHSLPFNRIPKLMTVHEFINIGKILIQIRCVNHNDPTSYYEWRKL